MAKIQFKQIFCKHKFEPWANIYGDLRDSYNGCTVLLCKKCMKRKYIKDFIKAPLNYNIIHIYLGHKLKGTLTPKLSKTLLHSMIQDKELYLKQYGGDNKWEELIK